MILSHKTFPLHLYNQPHLQMTSATDSVHQWHMIWLWSDSDNLTHSSLLWLNTYLTRLVQYNCITIHTVSWSNMFVRQSYIYSKTLIIGTVTAQLVSRTKKNQQDKNTSLFQETHCMCKNLAECMAGEETEREREREREREEGWEKK